MSTIYSNLISKYFAYLLLSGFLILTFLSKTIGQVKIESDLHIIENVSYYNESESQIDSLQMLNLVVPTTSDDCPLLIWIGGGAWSYVNRHVEMDLAKRLAQEGIAVACIGHRLSAAKWRGPEYDGTAQYPDHGHDVAAAIRWLYDNADKYNYSRDRFIVGGFSSGAHIAAMIGLDSTLLQRHNLTLDLIKGIIPISGTYDINHYHSVFENGSSPHLAIQHVQSVFGIGEEKFNKASPINYLNKLSAPILLMSDNSTYQYASIFEEAIFEQDFDNIESLHIHHIPHGDLWRHISNNDKSIYRDYIVNFIKSN